MQAGVIRRCLFDLGYGLGSLDDLGVIMYGRFSNKGITAIEDHAEALKRWESIKPIRGRAKDERPIGKRSKNYMQIRKNDDGSVACVLYETDVVTFYPDNKVRVHVPSVWRTNSTAQFIEAVFGRHRVGTGIKDSDVIMAVKGDDARYLRVGENVIFEVAQGGSLKLLSNDRAHTTLNINRKEMNAVRKPLAPFLKYLSGAIKLRDGVFSLAQAHDTMAYLLANGIVDGGAVPARSWYTHATWNLSVPGAGWYSHSVDRLHIAKMHKFFTERAVHGASEEWNHLACWVAMCAGLYAGREEAYMVAPTQAKNLVNQILMTQNPQVFVRSEEPRDAIQFNRYKNFEWFIHYAQGQA